MTAKPYNGHPSWNAWNVSLWINNDEGLYAAALDVLKLTRLDSAGKPRDPARRASIAAMGLINKLGLTRTPDGAKYSHNSVKLALAGLIEG